MKDVYQISERLFLIDAFDLGQRGRTGTYVLMEDDLTIIETSASPSVPYFLKGLLQLGLEPQNVKNIIVTHIHLDHAGGAGLMLEHCPNANVIVHPRGARHLIDPTRLIQGAKAVYGEKFNKLFDPILPIPNERVIVKEHGDTLQISDNCTLTFYDTPGHAKHHFCIVDSVSQGAFTGDTVGIYYDELKKDGIDFYIPSTSPNQFDPDMTLQSTELLESLNLQAIYFSHFGVSHQPDAVYASVRKWIPLFLQAAEAGLKDAPHDNIEKCVQAVEKELTNVVSSHLTKLGVKEDHPVYNILSLDLQVSAMGLVDYYQKKVMEESKK
ncbi:MBL fold metallo-hydrolase [Bacillus sp. FJAT-47783]|uniref:MBL fold metallo-hydrolase n=1 Tax=Bacillus sp. FJAT-47783 TaxID=2922712 RepID=UPI001FAB39C4|nr:MBL fold metallo-hydrolase [Bacillus sp. FJAT-47783]